MMCVIACVLIGNKFEFRAVGSSQSCAIPVTTINTIIADSLIYLANLIEKRLGEAGFSAERGSNISLSEEDDREDIIHAVICDTLKEHYKIVFNGNNYSDEWAETAKERGLPNLRTAPEALAVYTAPKNIDLFSKLGVLSPKEQHARSNITNEFFLKSLVIEGQSMVQLAENFVLPAALHYQKNVADSVIVAAQVLGGAGAGDASKLDVLAPQKQLVGKVAGLVADLMRATETLKGVLERERSEVNGEDEDPQHMLQTFHPAISGAMRDVRVVCDSLEEVIDDALWPLPKYSEMLFLV
jgi:glutamine synthetase